jgi:hypothetical protein
MSEQFPLQKLRELKMMGSAIVMGLSPKLDSTRYREKDQREFPHNIGFSD